MDAITALHTRLSTPRLTDPGPSQDDLACLLRAAMRAPDHGILRPWRFVILEGDQRKLLGEIFAAAQLVDDPESEPAVLDKVRSNPLRAPTVMVVVAETDVGNRVPVVEQVMAVAAATQNMMVAAHAMGIGAMWRTGRMASHDLVKERLGFASKDEVVAYLYLGTPTGSCKALPDESYEPYLRELPNA
ncbi:MAG: nitroreductase [Gammaproteobacteria bacterium]|jgi:nitroreductase|nr:nitroreductase [Gammaproteobacteria bacterium]MBQ0774010.1 nitroreductase [Gammaproteobacteria bacterium]